MNVLQRIFDWFQMWVLIYFSILALLYTIAGIMGLREIVTYARGVSETALRDLREHDFYKPISILIPAWNEELGIVANLDVMLELNYPEYEIIVANDGSSDGTLELLKEQYALVEVPMAFSRQVETAPIRAVYRSLRRPNLSVVDKENGGRGDAVNAALAVAKFPIVCAVDADSRLDTDALIRATGIFGRDETVIAVGGTLRPLNGAVANEQGKVVDLRAPARWVERFQVIEYTRAFFSYRSAWSSMNCLMIISGGFGLFRRESVLKVGGWRGDYVAEDMEITIKLHKAYRDEKRPYRILFTPDPICWTEVPSTFKGLRKQRDGWQRGLWEVLWHYRRMFLNPRYGRVGLVGIPFLWIFEAFAAEVEAFGYFLIVTSAILGILNWPFAILFFVLAILYSVLLSELALGIETLLLDRFGRFRDRMVLLASAFIEYMGFREIITIERAFSIFTFRRKRGKRWEAGRGSAPTASEGEPASSAAASSAAGDAPLDES